MKINYRKTLIALGGGLSVSLAIVLCGFLFSSAFGGNPALTVNDLPVIEGPVELASMGTGYQMNRPISYTPAEVKPRVEYKPTFEDIYAYIKAIGRENEKNGWPPLTEKEIVRIIRAVEKYCVVYDTNKVTMFSMITVESRYIVRIPSRKGAKYGRGLLQVSEIALKDFNSWTGKEYTTEDLYNIEKNIEVGVWAFNQNYYYGVETKFEHGAIIAYNVGVGDYKSNKHDLLNSEFKGSDYNYLEKVQKEYGILTRVDVAKNDE